MDEVMRGVNERRSSGPSLPMKPSARKAGTIAPAPVPTFFSRIRFPLAILVVLSVLFATGYLERRRTNERERRIEAARAVDTLPRGTESAWRAYVERQVARKIQRIGGVVRVNMYLDEVTRTTTYISTTTPFTVQCYPFGGTVYFSRLDHSETVYTNVFGLVSENWRQPEEPPPLPVNELSTAASQLSEALCVQIAEQVAAVMDSGSHAVQNRE